MKLWLLLTLAMFVQEPISTAAVLLQAYQLHYNIWLIHLIFALATIIDIAVGYYLGLLIKKKFGDRKLVKSLDERLEKFSAFIGTNGKIFALIVYSPIIFPISGFFIPWLDISFGEALVFTFIGEIIFWYLPEWLIVLGIKIFVGNPFTALYIIIIVSTLLSLGVKYLFDRKQK